MKVLVVEDVRRLADDIAEGLRDQGMAVDVAYDGLDAVGKIELAPYDVIVLDRDLPGLHGDVLCRMVTESHEPAMVLMLTAAGSPGERVSGLTLGADDYLAKPFHFPELVVRVRALARRKPAAPGRVYRAAGSSSTRCAAPRRATAPASTCRRRSSACSKRCCAPRPAGSAPRSCCAPSGTRTPTRSPRRSR